jgi:hypothetical protein
MPLLVTAIPIENYRGVGELLLYYVLGLWAVLAVSMVLNSPYGQQSGHIFAKNLSLRLLGPIDRL